MKPKLLVVLCAVGVLTIGAPAWGAVVPGDAGAVSAKMVTEMGQLAVPEAWKRAGSAASANGERFADQSDQQALATATEQDPGLFAAQPTRALDVPTGSRVERYLDDYSARIQVAGQAADVLAYSTTPVRVKQDGEERPVDLKLVDAGDAIEPKTPVVPLSFSDRLAGGITLGDDIRIHVVGADASADARVAGQQVFYANALTDSDVLATPLPSGLETFVQLRSTDSPHSIAYAFDLPAGAELVQRPGAQGSIDIVGDDGDVLATVEAPVSTDANGALVPTTMRVDGDHVILDVAVSASTALPVLVDPVIDNQFANGDAASSNGSFQNTLGWRRETSGPLGDFTFSPNADDAAAGGPCIRYLATGPENKANQLCVVTQSSRNYTGEIGQWTWRPPGGSRSYLNDGPNVNTDAYVYRAYVRHSYTRLSTSTSAFMYAGIESGRTGAWIGQNNNVEQGGAANDYRTGAWTFGDAYTGVISNPSFLRQYCASTDCAPDHPDDTNLDGAFFAFGIYARGTGNSLSANTQGAVFYEYDRSAPSVTHAAITDVTNWKRTGIVSTHVTGTDIGMGMKTVGVVYTDKSNNTTGASDTYNCSGGIASICPRVMPRTFDTNVDNLPEGTTHITSYGTDILGKTALGASVDVKVDRTAPQVSATSDLFDMPDNYVSGRGTYTATVGATDGGLSGIARVGLQLDDGVDLVSVTVPCPTDSTGARVCADAPGTDVSFDGTSLLAEGHHTLRAYAVDDAGNTGYGSDATIYVDHTPPSFTSDASFVAQRDDQTAAAIVSWDPPDDPQLADGSLGAGTSMYKVRYERSNDTDWSDWSSVDLPRIDVPDVAAGDSLKLEVMPLDTVDNVGPTQAVTTVIDTGGHHCDATAEGLPSDCGGDVDETYQDPPATIEDEPDDGTSSTRTAATRRYIRMQDGGDWVTIRSWHKSYPIGNAHAGWGFNKVNQTYTAQSAGYLNGGVLGGLDMCGWISASDSTNTDEPVDSGCPAVDEEAGRPSTSKFAAAVNCGICGQPSTSTVQIRRGTPEVCLNVKPSPLRPDQGYPAKCVNPSDVVTKAAIENNGGWTVKWRYITHGLHPFVMVRDDEGVDSAKGVWYFVARRYLGVLCDKRDQAGDGPSGYVCGPPEN